MHWNETESQSVWHEERRQQVERRRQAPLATLLYGHRYVRRCRGRRGSDCCGYYVDAYPPRLLVLALGIFLLNCADALFTTRLLALGSVELNPFMAFLIERNLYLFAAVKFLLTGSCLLFLVMHINFRLWGRLGTRQVLYLLLGTYACLVAYELYLLGWIQANDRLLLL